jgi:hypothetical protein
MLGDINDGGRGGVLGCAKPGILADEGPELVKIDNWAEILVLVQVEITHSDFAKVTGVVLVHESAVMVLTTSVTATSRMFPVFTNAAMASAYVATLFPILPQSCTSKVARN